MGSIDPTSQSLLVRAAENDQESWRQLVTLYAPLVVHWCRQAHIPNSERDDLLQEIFAAVAAGLKEYRRNHRGASFRAWMRGIARHKLSDYFRRRSVPAEGGTAAELRLRELPHPIGEPDLSEGPDELSRLYRRALEAVRIHFEKRTWQAFWNVVIDGMAVAEVATQLGDVHAQPPPGQIARAAPPAN